MSEFPLVENDSAEPIVNVIAPLEIDTFCDLLYQEVKDWRGPTGEAIDTQMLGDIFDLIDVDRSTTLSATEFLHAMRSLPEPVFPSGYTPKASEDQEHSEVDFRSGATEEQIISGTRANAEVRLWSL